MVYSIAERIEMIALFFGNNECANRTVEAVQSRTWK